MRSVKEFFLGEGKKKKATTPPSPPTKDNVFHVDTLLDKLRKKKKEREKMLKDMGN